MKKIQKIAALNFAVCQLVGDLVTECSAFLRDKDLYYIIPRMGLDLKVRHFQTKDEVRHGPFKGEIAEFCHVIIMPVNWNADEFIECTFFRPAGKNDRSWWPLRGLLSVKSTHKEFWCEPDTHSGRTKFHRTFDQALAEAKHSAK